MESGSGRPLMARPVVTLLFLGVVAWLLLLAGDGLLSLTDPDEVFYAETAREMLQHRTWTVPYIFDRPQFEKPILYYALTAAGFRLFGDSPATARFWPGAFGLIGIFATYALSLSLFRDRRAAFLAALVLATSFIYVALSHTVMTDMVFSVWVLLSLAAFHGSRSNPRLRGPLTLAFFAAAGLAVLTKGLPGVVFPFGTVLLYLAWRRDAAWLGSRWVAAGAGLFLLIAVPWHLAMYRSYGQEFVHEYFWNVHLRRILEAEHRRNDTWYFYPATIFLGVFPWSLIVLPAGKLAGVLLRKDSPRRDGLALCVIWIGVVWLVMQLAHSKLMSYILPLFPAVAILLGLYLAAALRGEREVRAPGTSTRGVGIAMAVIIAAMAAAGLVAIGRGLVPAGGTGAVGVAAVSLLGLAAGLVFFGVRRRAAGVVACLALVTPAILAGGLLARSVAEPLASSREACERLVSADTPGDSTSVILASQLYVRGVRFYTGRRTAVIGIRRRGFFSPHPIPFLDTDDLVAAFLDSQPVTPCVVRGADLRDLERIAAARGFRVISKEQVGNRWVVRISR